MTELIASGSSSVKTLLGRIEEFKHNPSAIQRVTLEFLEEITSGAVNIVDPTNPFVFLLEASAVQTAAAINEHIPTLRRMYAKLAVNAEDIYPHMADVDYLDRFATPAETEFTCVIQVNDILSKLVYDEAEKCYKAVMPRETVIYEDSVTYTLQYPVVIRRYENGAVSISYDTSIPSPLQSLTTNIIDYTVRRDPNLVDWLYFKVRALQFSINTVHDTVQESTIFNSDIVFTDNYYHARVWQRGLATNNKWVELSTTHSDQVYDAGKPTAVLTVTDDNLNVTIPLIYIKSGKVSGDIRISVYTTKGAVNINYSSYTVEAFKVKLTAIDEERDIDNYVLAMGNLTFYCFHNGVVTGGSSGIDLEELRDRVINNADGPQKLPITGKQTETAVEDQGFNLVTNIDVVTNLIYLATRKLPSPRNPKLLTAANMGISTFIKSDETIDYTGGVRVNGSRETILSNNIFINDNGILRLIDPAPFKSIAKQELVALNNSNQYLYNPFYYVLDTSGNELEIRIYNLDYPIVNNLSFISQNETLSLAVNTHRYTVNKTPTGYMFTFTTKSGNFYKQIDDNLVGLHIGYYPPNEKQLAYVNATLVGKTIENERIYQVEITTSYDINANDQIEMTNCKMFSNNTIEVRSDLITDIHIFHTTNSVTEEYRATAADKLIASFMLPTGSACVTHETCTFTCGQKLKNLWSRSRSLPGATQYKTYEVDIPLTYETDIYNKDPITGSIFKIVNGEVEYLVLHKAGDIVLDDKGNIVYKHRKGDVILNLDSQPIADTNSVTAQEIDVLMVDGKYYFATDAVVQEYRKEIVDNLVSWITNNLASIQKNLLEQTKIYFYPTTSLGRITAQPDGNSSEYLDAEQSITVNLIVSELVYKDSELRKKLEDSTISIIDGLISSKEVNVNTISDALKAVYLNSVLSFNVSGLGADKNYSIINVVNNSQQLCLKKKLVLQADNSVIIKEDVTVNFIKIGSVD